MHWRRGLVPGVKTLCMASPEGGWKDDVQLVCIVLGRLDES